VLGPRRRKTFPAIQEFIVHPQWFFTGTDGKRVGPYSPHELKQMACSGELTPTERVRRDGGSKPARAQNIEHLFSPFRGPR
jgi:hypothetical protein